MSRASQRGVSQGFSSGLPAAGGRLRRPTFFLEFTAIFAVVALVLSLAAGFAVTGFLARDIRHKTLDDATIDVSENTAKIIVPRLTPEQLAAPMSGEALQQFDAFIKQNALSRRSLRVNIWNQESMIIYSTNPELQGQTFQDPPVTTALAGETTADVDEPDGGHFVGLEPYSQVLEVHIPIVFEGSTQPAGVVEVYEDYGPIAAHIRDIQNTVFIAIAATLAALYVALLILVRRGSETMRRQRADLQSRTDELRSSYESIVAVLCAALDLRDNVTRGHAQRVSELASVVAWQMGMRKEEVRQIEKAAILHDIGKIGVADSVLSKPGALDEVEWAEMKRHPELGYQILQDIDFLRDVAEIVRAHHERYDGDGYPRGFKGEEIPLGARIFAVVDAYDAMTSHRPYRKAMPHSQAVTEIFRNSGTQFDPDVVKAFLLAEKRGLLEERAERGKAAERVTSRAAAKV